jgi:hypothetical protein
MPGIPLILLPPLLFFISFGVAGDALDFVSPAPLFITGTKSIEQIGHLPGFTASTEGCIVHVQ